MSLFILILIISFFLKASSKKKNIKKRYLFLVFGMLTLFSGLRGYSIGIDTINYVKMYIYVREYGITSFKLLNKNFEIGFLVYTYVLSRLFYSPTTLLLVSSAIICTSFAITFYRYSENIKISSFLFIIWFFLGTMNTMRQFLALSIFLQAIPFILKKNFFKFFILVVFASLFHISALIFILFSIFTLKKVIINKKVILLASAFFLTVILFFKYILNISFYFFKRYERFLYSEKYSSSRPLPLLTLSFFIILALGIFYFIIQEEKFILKKNIILESKYFFLLIYIISIFIFVFSTKFFILERLNIYFRYSICFVMPQFIRYLYSKNNLLKVILLIGFYTSFGYFGYRIAKVDGHKIFPYSTFNGIVIRQKELSA